VPRDSRIYLEDILAAATKIRSYVGTMGADEFLRDGKTVDAVVRNLEIIGEAVKQLPDAVRAQEPEIEWQKIAGLRDILIHAYARVDLDIIWDVVANKLPELETRVRTLLEKSGG
jgi:uncharacterized protein with HEPN domain